MSEGSHDVIIVGGGPAGSSCAIRLARTGLDVLLVEQKRFPRAKLCGEFVSPECADHLRDLGVLEGLKAAGSLIERTVFYGPSGRSVAVPSSWFGHSGHAIGISRAALDDTLLATARKAGATVWEESHITGILWKNGRAGGVAVRSGPSGPCEISAPLVIDATGRSRVLARSAEKRSGTGRRERANYVAFKGHLEKVDFNPGDCELYAYRGGYGGCDQVEDGRFNLCFIVSSKIARRFGGDADSIVAEVVRKNARAAVTLRGSRLIDEWLAVPIERYGRTDLSPTEGLLCVGDAASFIDPFTGSGILMALESAALLCSAIDDTAINEPTHFPRTLQKYRSSYSRAFERRLLISSLLRRAAFVPAASELLIRGLSLSQTIMQRIALSTRQDSSSA